MSTSYLTADELLAVRHLHQRAPYLIANISIGMLTVARHFGGCMVNGCSFVFLPGTDECVRADVLRFVGKLRGQKARESQMVAARKQVALL